MPKTMTVNFIICNNCLQPDNTRLIKEVVSNSPVDNACVDQSWYRVHRNLYHKFSNEIGNSIVCTTAALTVYNIFFFRESV